MTQIELEFIKDAFSQIIDDIAGNPDWQDAASAISADLGALERELERKAVEALPNLEQLVSRSNIAGELRNYTDWHTRLVKFAQLVADWQKEQMIKGAKERAKHFRERFEKTNTTNPSSPDVFFFEGKCHAYTELVAIIESLTQNVNEIDEL